MEKICLKKSPCSRLNSKEIFNKHWLFINNKNKECYPLQLFAHVVLSWLLHGSITVTAFKKMDMRRKFSEMNFSLVSIYNWYFSLIFKPFCKHEEIDVSCTHARNCWNGCCPQCLIYVIIKSSAFQGKNIIFSAIWTELFKWSLKCMKSSVIFKCKA